MHPPSDQPEPDLSQVRKELDTLAERRLRKAFDERDAKRWDALIRLEQELLRSAAGRKKTGDAPTAGPTDDGPTDDGPIDTAPDREA